MCLAPILTAVRGKSLSDQKKNLLLKQQDHRLEVKHSIYKILRIWSHYQDKQNYLTRNVNITSHKPLHLSASFVVVSSFSYLIWFKEEMRSLWIKKFILTISAILEYSEVYWFLPYRPNLFLFLILLTYPRRETDSFPVFHTWSLWLRTDYLICLRSRQYYIRNHQNVIHIPY